jgi:hypothetical protein
LVAGFESSKWLELFHRFKSVVRLAQTKKSSFMDEHELRSQAMGFMRNQQIRMAAGLLKRQYLKQGLSEPAESELKRQAAAIVDQAHDIAKKRGRNLLEILRELVADIRRS